MRAFFERWYPRLVRFLYVRLGDADQAEDLAQETFLRLLQARPRNPRAWIFTVAANLARDEARLTRGRARLLKLVEAEGDERRFAPDPEFMGSEELTRVRGALAALPERDRTLLLLRQEGFRYREIARQLGLAPGSIGSLLTRAERRFLKSYEAGAGSDARPASA